MNAAPIIRISLYVLAGWLAGRGLPQPIADYISNDPTVVEMVSEIVAGVVGAVTVTWWRIARRFGWAT